MDKNKYRRRILVIVFVVVSGMVCLFLHYNQQAKRHMVSEKGLASAVSSEEARRPTESPVKEEARPLEEPEALLYVHVCGAVEVEGVYMLPVGSRLQDGIMAAGGFRTDADTAYHNLAARLEDGQRVYVPTKEETEKLSAEERITSPSQIAGTGAEKQHRPVNLNTAGLNDLMTLSGIGESKAKSILQYREKLGRFQSIEELKNVSGIGDAMFERIKGDIVAE